MQIYFFFLLIYTTSCFDSPANRKKVFCFTKNFFNLMSLIRTIRTMESNLSSSTLRSSSSFPKSLVVIRFERFSIAKYSTNSAKYENRFFATDGVVFPINHNQKLKPKIKNKFSINFLMSYLRFKVPILWWR